ncbi:MAG: beta-propeller fold lactonase family protein [Planctomycetota bacterium]
MALPVAAWTAALAAGSAQLARSQSYVPFESGPIAPVRASADGSRLFVVDTQGGSLSVFDLRDPARPFLIAEIPVGGEPVSVQPRTRDEVWVVNQLSDSVAVVDVEQRLVIDTLRVVDEPSDVVFAGGRAFVSAATVDQVFVFDAATRAPLGAVDVFGKDPRALAVSSDGSRVYAVVQRSGNGTTVLPAGVVAPPAPSNPLLPPAPPQGLIVRADDPQYAAQLPYTLPDNDIAEIDVASLSVTRYFREVGTTNTGIAVHPNTGELWVANTDARNLVRFEPNLRGHAIDSRITRITIGAQPVVTPFDLNPGINYAQLPNSSALATALAEPFGVAIDPVAARVYVAAHGTDRIGVLDLSGNVVARVEMLPAASGAQIATRDKRGPRGLALHPSSPHLYVLNRLSDTLAVVDTQTLALVDEQPVATVDAMPPLLREGRNFLYDSKLSGNGTMSCASCHIDGDTDGIAWDLGDPSGVLEAAPPQPFPFNVLLVPFHPMKGPMTTQTLRGLDGTGVLHWRGDKADFQAFNPAFDKLMGGTVLPQQDMDDYAAFVAEVVFPPNPNQLLDRSLRTTPASRNEASGRQAYLQVVTNSQVGPLSCNTCHALPTGTNGLVVNAQTLATPQQLKVAHLRNLYRKVGFENAAGPQKAGVGFTHDGVVGTLDEFLQLPQFTTWPNGTKDDIVAFLESLDTGTAPAVGYQFAVDQVNAQSAAVLAGVQLLQSRAAAGDLDVVVHGRLAGRPVGLLLDPATGEFEADETGVGPFTAAQLQQQASLGAAELLVTAVLPGTGERIARDRDGDGVPDGDERAARYGSATPGCSGEPLLYANSEPFVGNDRFGYAMHNAQAQSVGLLAMALGSASIAALGIDVLVDPSSAVTATLASGPSGDASFAFPLPGNPALVGTNLFAQVLWLDTCGSQLWASSAGVAITLQP